MSGEWVSARITKRSDGKSVRIHALRGRTGLYSEKGVRLVGFASPLIAVSGIRPISRPQSNRKSAYWKLFKWPTSAAVGVETRNERPK